MLSLLFTIVMANENYFSFNDWDYGACSVAKQNNVEVCKTEYQTCFRVENEIGRDGKRYTKFACHVDQDVEQ